MKMQEPAPWLSSSLGHASRLGGVQASRLARPTQGALTHPSTVPLTESPEQTLALLEGSFKSTGAQLNEN